MSSGPHDPTESARVPDDVFGRIDGSICGLDTDWRITSCSPQAAALFDRDADDLLGTVIWEVAPWLADPTVSDPLRRAVDAGAPALIDGVDNARAACHAVRVYPGPDGTTLWFDEWSTGGTTPRAADTRSSSVDINDGRTRAFGRNRALRAFHDIATDSTRPFEAQLRAVLELGASHLGLDVGILAEIEPPVYTVGHVATPAGTPDTAIGPGATFELTETFCASVVESNEVVGFHNAGVEVQRHPAYREFGLEAYLGAPVVVDGERYGTVNFSSHQPRATPFSESEETFVRLVAQWVGKELGRQRDRREVRAGRDRLRQIIDILPQLVFVKDAGGTFLLANEATATAYGTTVAELEGSTDADFASSRTEVERFRADDRAVIESGEPKHIAEEPLTTADGERRVYETTKIPYDPVGSTDPAVLGVATDVTELRRREEALEMQSAAMEAAMDGISVLDTDDEYIYMNQAHAGIFEYEAEELIGSTWRRLYEDDEIERIEREVFPEIERAGEWRGETIGRKRDGSPVRQEIALSLLEDGKLICTNRDVTERYRREQDIRELKEQLDRAVERATLADSTRAEFLDSLMQIVNSSQTGIWLGTADMTEVLYVNDTIAETTGLSKQELYDDLTAYFSCVHPDDRREQLEMTTRMAQWADENDPPAEIQDDYRIYDTKGDLRYLSNLTFPIFDAENRVAQWVGFVRDITERKRLEQSLRESEQSLREVTAVAADADRDFRTKLASVLRLGCDRLGVDHGFLTRVDDDRQHVVEAWGDHPDLQPGTSVPLSETYCRRTVETGGVFHIRSAADEGWEDDPAYEAFGLGCYLGGTVVVDGDVYGTLCFADHDNRTHPFDETERAFADLLVQWVGYELAGDAVETKLRRLNETAQRLLTTGDADEIARIAIESAQSVLELPITGVWWHDEPTNSLAPAVMTDAAAEVVGDQPTFVRNEALAWESFARNETLVYDDLQSVDGRYNDETLLQSEMIVPLGGHGVLVSASTVSRAISATDRELLTILAATVEEALNRAEHERLLYETRAQLERSNEELEQFAYAASHDLQEPLRTVSSYLTLIERRYRDELDADAETFIDFAVDGADRMREMIQALLAYSRVTTSDAAFEPVEMATVFEQVGRNLELMIDESNATVSFPSSAGAVAGDESQLVQLFQNLVENAIKYSEDDARVAVSVDHDGDVVEYAVTDNGIGIDPDRLDDVFEVFRRLHTREEFAGTGIGLSVCRKIVDHHGGTIRAESTPGRGSTFRVRLRRKRTP
ncbi:PAS domain-containing protein [Salinigranum halophilum]|uniref:PAS domain-containing protein n=1 Tax=Salinigranum halophilum TaxID=2565931 RepID=UPI0010A8DDF9|nr:PAS domain-containing protein [Salinigranum halophilum]